MNPNRALLITFISKHSTASFSCQSLIKNRIKSNAGTGSFGNQVRSIQLKKKEKKKKKKKREVGERGWGDKD